MSKIISALYNHKTDCVEVTLDNQFHAIFNCQNCNAQVKLADPLDVSYLTCLAREEPGFYANNSLSVSTTSLCNSSKRSVSLATLYSITDKS